MTLVEQRDRFREDTKDILAVKQNIYIEKLHLGIQMKAVQTKLESQLRLKTNAYEEQIETMLRLEKANKTLIIDA